MRKRRMKLIASITMGTLLVSMPLTVYAGAWEQNGAEWKYKEDSGNYASGWTWVDGKSYYFDEAGKMLFNTETPDGYTVNADGAWVVDGVVQTQTVGNSGVTDDYDAQYPLKGRLDGYFATDAEGRLSWKWEDIYLTYTRADLVQGIGSYEYRLQSAICDKNPAYLVVPTNDIEMVILAELAGISVTGRDYAMNHPQKEPLLQEVRSFLNSFDWRKATDLEKAIHISEWIQKAEYDDETSRDGNDMAYSCLVEKKTLCNGYWNAARLLGLCVDIPVNGSGTISHIYPLYYVDGVWLANEPTSKNQYFTIADVYERNLLGEYQQIGRYCDGVGYNIPTSVNQFPNVRNIVKKGQNVPAIYFR